MAAELARALQLAPAMRTPTILFVAASLLLLPHLATASPVDRIQVGLASEHGGGLGAGVGWRLSDRLELAVGAGLAPALGYSSVEGWVGAVAPGLGLGLRYQLPRGFYVGPTLAANYALGSHAGGLRGDLIEDELSLAATLDVGIRFDSGLALGIGSGVALSGDELTVPVALTLALGF